MDGKPDVLILSGFLGSGKTTLLMQLVAHARAQYGDNYLIAIIENEIGSASVDSSIIQDAGYSVTEMLAGCVCCTLAGELIPALRKLEAELEPNLVILEATGVALPTPMRDTLVKYGGYPVRIVTLVDASRWERIRIPLHRLLEGQVGPADVICLNKIDLVSDEQVDVAEQEVREMNATPPIIRISAAQPIAADDLDLLAGGPHA